MMNICLLHWIIRVVEAEIFLFTAMSVVALGPTCPIKSVLGTLSSSVNWSLHEADRPHLVLKVKNQCSYAHIPPHAFMVT